MTAPTVSAPPRRSTSTSRPAKLNVAQSAMLAAMINEPGYFSPDPHAGQPYQALLARWHYVLTNMVRDGSITQQQAAAQKFPKIAAGQRDNGWTGYRGYIMQAVESELENTYGFTKQQIYTRGLRIVTTFNESTMNALYRAVSCREAADEDRCREGNGHRRPGTCTSARCWRSRAPGRSWPCTAALAMAPGTAALRLRVQHGNAELEPGRILVQALRAGHRGGAGHERAEQRARRVLADLDPAGLERDRPADPVRPCRRPPTRTATGSSTSRARTAVR